jgi:vacuolar protein sorting-associated protein 41
LNLQADFARFRFDDCSICGITLYTPSLLLVLAYRTRDDDDRPITPPTQTTPRKGVHHRQNGLSPEVRLIDIASKEEADMDTLTMSRYQSLSAADYHLSTLYIPQQSTPITGSQRGALGALGGGIWDAGVNATRIFSSGGSVRSLPRSGEFDKSTSSVNSTGTGKPSLANRRPLEGNPSVLTPGLKIFIHSPYDCVLALKRGLGDHLAWLESQKQYKEAWELIDKHPEIATTISERQEDSNPSTPRQSRQSLADFFDDTASQTTISANRGPNTAAEKEKRRIGELWLQQLLSPEDPSQRKDWSTASKVAGRVLNTSEQWEKWVWIFTQAGRFDEITPYVPSQPMRPPLPSIIYELILGHYIRHDPKRFRDLLEQWDADLFEVGSITAAVEEHLKSGEVTEDTITDGEAGSDWRLLLDGLAKLYLADAKPKEALHAYIQLQNADAAMGIIRDYHLLPAVADDIPGFLLLRISRDQLESSALTDLEEASSEGVHLLVDEAFQGVVRPSTVIRQLERKGKPFQPLLFFYVRALWKGQGSETTFKSPQELIISEGDILAAKFGDLALELFAEYDRPLFMEFLKSLNMYRFEKATAVCESREYIPELV